MVVVILVFLLFVTFLKLIFILKVIKLWRGVRLKYDNGYRIYVDIMTGKNCNQFRLLTWILFIGQFVHSLVKGWMEGSLFYPATSFTSLDIMIIWCKIQVIINPLIFGGGLVLEGQTY